MPTGYTAIIEERADLTFRDFALRCARERADERKSWIDALYASL
jgi:hypothetical protein